MTHNVTPLRTPLAKPERFLPTPETVFTLPALFAPDARTPAATTAAPPAN